MADLPTRAALEARFWGRITAGLGHEMNNVLATVDGLAGLQSDLLSAPAEDAGRHARIVDAAARIEQQVERGRGLTLLLRSFAHSVDKEDAPLDVNARLEDAAALCRRFAVIAGVELVPRPGSAKSGVHGRAFDLVHVLSRCIFAGLETAQSGEQVELAWEASSDELRIVTTGGTKELPPRGGEFAPAALGRLATILGGNLDVHARDDRRCVLHLDLPKAIVADSSRQTE